MINDTVIKASIEGMRCSKGNVKKKMSGQPRPKSHGHKHWRKSQRRRRLQRRPRKNSQKGKWKTRVRWQLGNPREEKIWSVASSTIKRISKISLIHCFWQNIIKQSFRKIIFENHNLTPGNLFRRNNSSREKKTYLSDYDDIIYNGKTNRQ